MTELEQRGAARLKARLGQFVIHSPLDVGLILAVVGLAALFFLESDDCYFVYWQYDSWKDFLLTRPDMDGALIVGVPQNGRYLGNLIGVLLAKSYETPLFFLRVVYFAGDIDRRYCQYNLGDHGDLLEQAVRFALAGQETLRVQGKGYVDCRLYRQADRFLLHLVNLSGANRNPGFLEEEYEVGPFEIAVRAQEFPVERAQLRVRGGSVPVRREGDWFVLALDRLESHELIVLE